MSDCKAQLRELRRELAKHGLTAEAKGSHIAVYRDGKRVGTLAFARRSLNARVRVQHLLRDIANGVRAEGKSH